MCLPLPQVEEEVAAQSPRLAVVGTRGQLAGVGPNMSKRQGGIVDLVTVLQGNREGTPRGWSGHGLFDLGLTRDVTE